MKEEHIKYFKNINQMAFPILMNYMLSIVFEIMDKAIVGRYSVDGFAAVGVASSIVFVVTGSLGILSTAYNIIAANIKGKNDNTMFEKIFNICITISIALGIIFVMLSFIFGELIYSKIYGLTDNVLELTLQYFYPASFTVLLNLIIFIYSAYFRNQNNTKITFYCTIIATVVNLFFDYGLVYGKFGLPSIGVKGTAYGSIIGLLASIVVYVAVKKKLYKTLFKFTFDFEYMKKIIKLYLPLLIQDIMEETIFVMILTGIITKLGTYNIASYNLLSGLGDMLMLPAFAFAMSSMTLAIQERAKNNIKGSNVILTMSTVETMCVIILASVIVLIFPDSILGFISTDKMLIENCKTTLIVVIIAYLINGISQILKCFLQGYDEEKFILIISTIISFVSLIWIYLLSKAMSINGIFIGLMINYVVCIAVYLVKYSSKNKQERLKINN